MMTGILELKKDGSGVSFADGQGTQQALADPHGVLAPNVILTRDQELHLRSLKSAPAAVRWPASTRVVFWWSGRNRPVRCRARPVTASAMTGRP